MVVIYIKDINKSITNLTAKVFDEKDNIISSKDLTQNLIDENIVNNIVDNNVINSTNTMPEENEETKNN